MAGSITSATQSLSSILRQTTLDDHEEVLKAANAVLKKSKNDLDTQHVKVVALVKLDRFEDALRVLEDGGDRLKERAQLERAYALYKSGSWEEAARVFRGGDGTRAMLHVQAQTLYRLEDFPTAADIYKSLSTSSGGIENEVNDLRINSSATDAQLFWTGQGQLAEHKKTDREDLEAFETAYNAACRSIARGELAQGEMLLRRAKDLCSALDELSEEDKKAELLPIIVQQIYVLSRLSKSDEASRLALDIKVAEISDLSTQKVAQSNIISTELRPENPFIAHRSFNSTTNIPKSDKLFQFQDRILQRNAYALDLLALKYSGVSKSTSKIISEIPAPTTDPDTNLLAVFNAAAHAQGQTGKAGLKETLALLSKRPNDVGLILTVIQLYILTNNHGSAIALLEGFFKRLEASTSSSDLDVRFAPGLVAVVVSLYRLQGRKTHIKQELVKAASYWRRKSKANPDLLRAAGTALLDSDERADLEEAGAIFSELRAQDPTNRFLTAGYVASVATIDSSKCVNEITQLTPVSRLIAGLDAAALEEGGIHLPPAASKQDSSKKRSAEGLGKPAKKRIRKSRLPKNLDSSKPADPERWLPLRERSTFRPKGKKGKGRAGGAQATQGGFTDKVEESLELAGGEGKVKVQTVANGGAGKGKKKKGKR